jgi:acetyl esterase/lipase
MKPPALSIHRRQLILAGTMAALTPAAFTATASPVDPDAGLVAGDTLDLWPSGTPGAERVTAQEEVIERLPDGALRDRYAQHVTRPTLTLFKPRTAWNGITLLIVPGGGYVRVVIDKEGFECADWFTRRGFAAAVLRYRMPADGWAAGADAPVHDALRAIRVLRTRNLAGAAPRKVGIMGFSAGGHLAARVITEPGLSYPRQDEADDASARPDFAVLMYPVIATTGPAAHRGSADQLRAAGVAEADLAKYSPQLNITAKTPPTLLVHAGDDASVPVQNSLLMYEALQKAGIRSELHVFDSGGHGFGLRGVAGRDVAVWPTLVQNWALSDDSKR